MHSRYRRYSYPFLWWWISLANKLYIEAAVVRRSLSLIVLRSLFHKGFGGNGTWNYSHYLAWLLFSAKRCVFDENRFHGIFSTELLSTVLGGNGASFLPLIFWRANDFTISLCNQLHSSAISSRSSSLEHNIKEPRYIQRLDSVSPTLSIIKTFNLTIDCSRSSYFLVSPFELHISSVVVR